MGLSGAGDFKRLAGAAFIVVVALVALLVLVPWSASGAGPTVTITSAQAGPMANGFSMPLPNVTPLNVATFSFQASGGGSPSYTCTLDGQTSPCSSPKRYALLSPGRHVFSVTASSAAGVPYTPASMTWTIGSVPAVVIGAQPRSEKPLRAKFLRPRQMLQTNRGIKLGLRSRASTDELESPDQAIEPGSGDCRVVACPGPAEGGGAGGLAAALRRAHGASPQPTPPLSSGPFSLNPQGNGDPQIAASNEYLVVSAYSRIYFFTKDGKLVTKDKNGNAIVNPIPTYGFWHDAYFSPKSSANLNKSLNLPQGLQCDPTIDGYPADPDFGISPDPSLTSAQQNAVRDCYKRVYDTRVIFDGFRKRFWILSALRNDPAEYQPGKNKPIANLPVPERTGLRERFVIAVSKDQDPRDGWYQYTWDSSYDNGACNDVGSGPAPPPLCPGTLYRPVDHTDYPTLGISKNYVYTSIGAGNTNPWTLKGDGWYTSLVAFEADKLAGGGCSSVCGWNYGRFSAGFQDANGNTVVPPDSFASDTGAGPATAAAVQHDGEDGWSMLTANFGQYSTLAVLGFRPLGSNLFAPPLEIMWVPQAPEQGPNDMPQGPPDGNSQRVRVANLGNYALRSAARDGKLSTVWEDCRNWTGSLPECATSIHLFEILGPYLLEGVCPCVAHDRVFGLRNEKDDPPGSVVYYGNPAVEVNKNHDLVVVYNRSGKQVPFEARYSAFMHGESDIRPSALLKAGSYPPFSCNKQSTYCANFDTSGIAVDPFDDTGVWMISAYSVKGGSSFAIGKVFGTLLPDISVGKLLLSASQKKIKLIVPITDAGDGRSGRGTGRVYLLVPHRRRRLIGKFSVRGLGAGKTARLRLLLHPRGLHKGRYTLQVVVRIPGQQYGKSGDISRLTFKISR